MRDRRRKQGTVAWLIKLCALMLWIVIMVESRKLRTPSRRKQAAISRKTRHKPQLRQYTSDEYEGLIDPLEDYAAFSEYPDETAEHELINSQKYSVPSAGGFQKPYKKPVKYIQPVFIRPKTPSKPAAPVIREVHHIPVSDNKLDKVGSGIAAAIKYFLLTMLAVIIPTITLPFLMLPLKLLVGLKLIIIANVVVVGILAAKLKHNHDHNWGSAAAVPSSGSPTTNSQLSISQPVTTVINTPTQQQQQQQPPPSSSTWSYTHPWWPFYNSHCSICNTPSNSTSGNNNNNNNAKFKRTLNMNPDETGNG